MADPSSLAARVRAAALTQPTTLGDGDCEELRPGLLGQPVNTVSSLAYVGVGAWLASRTVRGSAPSSVGVLVYAASTTLAGVGSVAYHGPQFPGAQTLHDLPILGIAGIGLGVPVARRARGRRALPGWSSRRGAALAATGAVAGAAYLAGSTGSRCCRSRSLLQWHGLWHLGTAVAMGIWGTVVWPADDEDADGEVIDLTDDGVAEARAEARAGSARVGEDGGAAADR